MNTPVVWITGAGRGIGRAIAEKFARDGAIVAITARTRTELDTLHAELASGGLRALTVPCNIRNPSAIQSAYSYIVQEVGPVDVLVNNAGISIFKSFVDTSLEEFEAVYETNFRGPIAAIKVVLPSMIEQKQGHIFNIISITTRKLFRNSAAYAASKASLAIAMDNLREEVRGFGIKVINIVPGATDTAIWPAKIRSTYRNRMLQPESIADIVLSSYHQPLQVSVEEIVIRPAGGDL
jgi:NADP-dependent 3-hydroxy acid dehydrogenase YdfG